MSPWALEMHGLCFAVGLFSLVEPEACVLFNEESSVLLVQEFSCIFFSSGNFLFHLPWSLLSELLLFGSWFLCTVSNFIIFLHGFVVPETSLTLL